MITISVRDNFPEVKRALAQLKDNVATKVMAKSLNTTMNQAKPAMAKEISGEYKVTSAQVKERLQVIPAVSKSGTVKLQAVLQASNAGKGRSMNLIAFVEKSISIAQMKKRIKKGEGGLQTLRQGGVVKKALRIRFQIKRSGGVKVIPIAFIANDGRTVFVRVGKARLPIKALNTIAITQMFNTKRINEVVVKTSLDRFDKNFTRELRGVLQGWAK